MNWNPRSVLLLFGAVHALLMAVFLFRRTQNTHANRFLAVFLITLAMILSPNIIGFMGFYQRWPWLSFMPYDVSFSAGPLIYFYLASLVHGKTTPRWQIHFIPVAIQFTYYCILFVQPLSFKDSWADSIHDPYVESVETLGALAFNLVYLIAALRLYRRYMAWLAENASDVEPYRMPWLRNFLYVVFALFLATLGFELVDELIYDLGYTQMFWLYLAMALCTYYLGVEGWRHADILLCRMPQAEATQAAADAPEQPTEKPAEDLRAKVQAVTAFVTEEQSYLDPEISLQTLARALGMSAPRLSRILNEGNGENFNAFINRFRIEAVKKRLEDRDDDADILQIALDCGFNSKTSFNRVFKRFTETTPLVYRREALRRDA